MSLTFGTDEYFMREALKQAELAYEDNEIPVGAIITSNKKIIARAYNQTEKLTDVTAHAEIIALTSAFNYFGAKYLPECTLYVTLEPCVMCAGALNWAQLGKVVYGAPDKERGYARFDESESTILHPKTEVKGGVLSQECSELVKMFFQRLRKR